MNLAEVEQRVGELDLSVGFDLIYDLLLAYGLPKASVSRLRNGSYDKSDFEQEVLWKNKVFYRFEPKIEDDALYALIDDTRTDERIDRFNPRFLIIRNEERLLARDQMTGDTLDIDLVDLPGRADFFLPWAGIEKTQVENANLADIKAAEKMAKLYDEIIGHNEIESAEDTHNLNVFFSRLLFCFFAEDTGVFESGQFTQRIASLTQDSGADVNEFLDRLFAVLDTPPSERSESLDSLNDYGYVNGSLFSDVVPSPKFTARARALVIDCGSLDWAQINPDIFGSMIQAVVQPGQRAGLGMHYTSVENIMKVIRPLFLDQLNEDFAAAEDSPRKLRKLLDRIEKIKVFDPACGSGNFLVIAYKELRKLENAILGRLTDLEPHKASLFDYSRVNLDNFYGIEIDDFAHEIAQLSLWLAKHQMNLEFEALFGVELGLIPLQEGGNIAQGNAIRVEWELICPSTGEGEVFVLGNPPYLGARRQDEGQKADLQSIKGFGAISKNLDYVAAWWFKGADYLLKTGAHVAFVCTNSISQGEQVSLLWPSILDQGVEISFAVQSFRWSNQARGGAGVTCVVIGIAPAGDRSRFIFSSGRKREVESITPYLTGGPADRIVHRRSHPASELPPLVFGSMPNDGGHLILSANERQELLKKYPSSEPLVRSFLGAAEFINGDERSVLWIKDDQLDLAKSLPPVAARLEEVRQHRERSKRPATNALASVPHLFGHCAHQDGSSIILPAVSSENRHYIPIGFLDSRTVISNRAYAIYDAVPWVFGLIQSRMHMVWVRAVSGRLESRYSYSSGLVYNTFPVPPLTDPDKTELRKGALGVLGARERFSGNTLAELYDPDKMPTQLREAHTALDGIVDRIYRDKPFESDDERLEMLFAMYSEMTAEESDA